MDVKLVKLGLPYKQPYNDAISLKLKACTEQWVTEIVGKRWTDDPGFAQCALFCNPNVTDFPKLLQYAKYIVATFTWDDYLDHHLEELPLWHDFYLNKCHSITDSTPEKLLRTIWLELRDTMPAKLFERLTQAHIDYLDGLPAANQMIVSPVKTTDLDAFLSIRVPDLAMSAMLVLMEYLNGICVDMDMIFNNELLNHFYQLVITQVTLANDLYSLKKDSKQKNYNYVYLLSNKNQISVEEAIDVVVKEVEDMDIEMIRSMNEIIAKRIDIPEVYLKESINASNGGIYFFYWSKRYH